jgi:flagellar biosynthesis protein FlhF
MLIKNFQAGTIQDALDLVRKEFGHEAVILKTDIIKDNGRRLFSVTAARDFQDESIVATAAATPPAISTKRPALASFPVIPPLATQQQPPKQAESGGGKGRLESAILDVMLPELLTGEIKGYYLALRINEVESDLALKICRKLQQSKSFRRDDLAKIIHEMTAKPASFPENEKNIVFVGPCGSGKSSLLAKFAAELVFNRKRQVTLSTLDYFRPGAEQEVSSVADVLSIAQDNGNGNGNGKRPKANSSCHLVDTTGLIVGDDESFADLQTSLEKIRGRYTILVLSLTTSWKNNRRFLDHCLPLGIDAITLTQLDVAQSCGAIVNIAAHDYPPIIGVSESRLPTGKVTPFDARRYLDKLIGDDNG